MKYKAGNYLQLSREIFADEYKKVSTAAKWLYIVLVECEHRYTNTECNWFFRSDAELAADAGIGIATVKRAKKELKEAGLIETGFMHWTRDDGKKSAERITTYVIVR